MMKKTQPKILPLNFLSKLFTHYGTECHFFEHLKPFCNQVNLAEYFHGRFHSLLHLLFTPQLEHTVLKMSGQAKKTPPAGQMH